MVGTITVTSVEDITTVAIAEDMSAPMEVMTEERLQAVEEVLTEERLQALEAASSCQATKHLSSFTVSVLIHLAVFLCLGKYLFSMIMI
jgi:hypothetical protein